ncbi:hypothetical protein BVRB_019510, partial [Beta vulgaris subsp. vulgaris]
AVSLLTTDLSTRRLSPGYYSGYSEFG